MNLKTPGREDETETLTQEAKPLAPATGGSEAEQLAQAYLHLIGGAANVSNIDACISRLRLTLKDTSKVDEAAARRAGASGVIRLNEQNVQIIVGPKAELVASAMQKLLQA
jgi:PTS system N-acetylglucosamine-specific IIC component